jgi:hypothetical protein
LELEDECVDAAVELRASLIEPVRAGAPPSVDSARLARAAREGDRAAFGDLYARYARMVHGILLVRVPRREVDDLVLPEAYREPLILRLVEGMTGPEIATRTGLTPGSVRVNLHRGMQMLRERLGKEAVS